MFKKLFSDNKAVSPVIGVMLMIVVTVILAAAVSSYATSVDSQETAPQAVLTTDVDGTLDIVTLEHLSGDTLYKKDIEVEIASGFPLVTGYVDMSTVSFAPHTDYLAPGDMMTITAADYTYEDKTGIGFYDGDIYETVCIGDTIRITLIDTNSGQTIYSSSAIVNP